MKKRALTTIMILIFCSILGLSTRVDVAHSIGPITIQADGSITPSNAPIRREGSLYVLTDNITSDNYGIGIDRSNVTLDGAGFTLQGLSTIYGNGITFGGKNVTVRNMIIKGFHIGVDFLTSSYCQVIRSTITENGLHGVQVYVGQLYPGEGIFNSVIGNEISANGHSGIYVSLHTNVSVVGNRVAGNGYIGIYVYGSWGATLVGNTVSDNPEGIRISGSSGVIAGNNIKNNNCGIYVFMGMPFSIYHNNFIDNTKQVDVSEGSVQTWENEYPSGGNFWSDYVGVDSCKGSFQNQTGSDGIGDSSYIIRATLDADGYPLMVPYSDITPPSVTVVSPQNRAYSAAILSLKIVINETAWWIGYSLDSHSNVTIWGNTTISGLSEGTHTLTVYSNDTTGNMGQSEIVNFTVDTVPPYITIISPENKTSAAKSISLAFTVNEETSWIGYSLDGIVNQTIPSQNGTIEGLTDGSHSLIIYAKDTVGNVGASQMVYFTINTPQTDNDLPQFQWIIIIIATIVILVGATGFILRKRRKSTTERSSPQTKQSSS